LYSAHPKRAPLKELAVSWLTVHISEYGQRMPDCPDIHLPPGSWFQVFQKCATHQRMNDGVSDNELSLSYFHRLRKAEFPRVKMPKVQRFTKCKECSQAKVDKAKTLDRKKRKEITKCLDKHLRAVRVERRKYWKHRRKAKTHMTTYLSMIVDGMDQAKTMLPFFVEPTSLTESQLKLKTHVVGVLVHGRGAFAYHCSESVPGDPNLVIHCLMRTIMRLIPPALPEVLYLQADNTSRENKNRTLFGFCGFMVQIGLFRKVGLKKII
jgi:hypothetical protein